MLCGCAVWGGFKVSSVRNLGRHRVANTGLPTWVMPAYLHTLTVFIQGHQGHVAFAYC